MSRLFYVPLEPVQGRYSEQWSRAKSGWLERKWQRHGVDYVRINGPRPEQTTSLGIGKVLNPVRRSEWGFEQSLQLCRMMELGSLKSEDVVYFDDFWHPGLEMVAQTRETAYDDDKPKFYSFCHAQSVDNYDFMRPMSHWARPIEQGYMNIYSGVFVNNSMLQEAMQTAFGVRNGTAMVHNAGHVFDSDECWEHVRAAEDPTRTNKVVFSSRFDTEKQPALFLEIVKATKRIRPDIEFVVCSGGPLKSDLPHVVEEARYLQSKGLLTIADNLSKADYYNHLRSAKVQLSTSLQDWVSFCLLEAVTFGCFPCYPNFRSFPEAFGKKANHLYPFHPRMTLNHVVSDVALRLVSLTDHYRLHDLVYSDFFPEIVMRHNRTWENHLTIMGIEYAN